MTRFIIHFILLFLFSIFSLQCVQLSPCNKLNSEFNVYVSQNNACLTDDNCIIVGAGSCECYGLARNAISKNALNSAQPFLERFRSCRDYFSCDSVEYLPYAASARCVNGRCEEVMVSCGTSGSDY